METLNSILGLISVDSIWALSPVFRYLGLAIILLSLLRALYSLLRFRIIKAFTSLVSAVVLAIMLTVAGRVVEQTSMPDNPRPSAEKTSNR